MEENTCFFWRAHDADSAGALRWARDGCVGKPQVNEQGDTSEKVVGMRAAGCAVVAQFRTGRAIRCWRSKVQSLESSRDALVTKIIELVWCGILAGHRHSPNHFSGPPPSLSHSLHYPRRPLLCRLGGFGDGCGPADKPSGCWLLPGPPHSWSWRDRSDAENSRDLTRWGGRRFRTTVPSQRWVDTIFGDWYYFFWLPAAADWR